ncbi:MAG: DUF89 family protein [Chloroflexi bacterium]|nr:DUF89 family protein [Chloroflexota bacterium]
MQIHIACASCIIDDLRGALETTVADETKRLAILREAMTWLGQEFDQQRIPSFYITRVHRLLKQRTGLEMPFRSLRQQCNKAGLVVRQQVAQELAHIRDNIERLRWLALWAIAGNHLDFRTVGTGYHLAAEEITASLAIVVAEGLAIDHIPALLPLLHPDCHVLYLADNVGEIALDTLLVAELQRYGCQVTVAVKGGPITSDAVWEDAQSVGMDKLAPLILTGPDTLGLPLDEMSTDLRRELERAQVIISKGQANYYACSELARDYGGVFFCLLRTKCPVAAQNMGLDQARANVALQLPLRRD